MNGNENLAVLGKSSAARNAIVASGVVAVLMLAGKWMAWLLTGSTAILSDAAESVVHIAATGVAVLGFFMARQEKDRRHPYGHGKIAYFSAGFEGAAIFLAGLFIVYSAIRELVVGPDPRNLGWGMAITAGLVAVNLALGMSLIRIGRRENQAVLEANGKHVLTDVWTSLGVLVGIGLVALTGLKWLDPLVALLVGLHILTMALGLMRRSAGALLDEADPARSQRILERLEELRGEGNVAGFHQLRHRQSNNELWVELHVLLDSGLPLGEAHNRATRVEKEIQALFADMEVHVTTHLEPDEHRAGHPRGHPELPDPLLQESGISGDDAGDRPVGRQGG